MIPALIAPVPTSDAHAADPSAPPVLNIGAPGNAAIGPPTAIPTAPAAAPSVRFSYRSLCAFSLLTEFAIIWSIGTFISVPFVTYFAYISTFAFCSGVA
ncbi:hypothetical protein WT00_12975 [Burkholderia territorii]|nr:hypothetical protein WT00_12975 [Burkholderia territorii]